MGAAQSPRETHDYQALPTSIVPHARFNDDDADIYSIGTNDDQALELAVIEDEGGGKAAGLALDVFPDAKEQIFESTGSGTTLYRLQDLHTPYRVFRKGLLPNGDVAVRVGPVLGRITDRTAVVLLEVDCPPGQPCECAVNFARVCPSVHDYGDGSTWTPEVPLSAAALDSLRFIAEGSVSISFTMEPRRPHAFTVSGLLPSTRYLVLLSGVSPSDVQERVGKFKTLPDKIESLRLVAVSGHVAPSRSLGTENPWQCIARYLRWGTEVAATLHLGSTMDASHYAAEAARELADHAVFKEGPRRDLERKARAHLRQAYCDSWGRHDGLRRLVGESGAQLPIFVPPVQNPQLMKDLAAGRLKNYSAAWEARMLLKVALDVYREYQRVLWNADAPGGAAHARATAVNEATFPSWAALQSSSSTGPGSSASVMAATYDSVYSPPRPSLGEFWVDGGPMRGDAQEPAIEEWHFHRYGPICVVMLDTKGNFCANGIGAPGKRPSLLSKRQWESLVQVLRDDSIRILIVASDEPFLMRDKARTSQELEAERAERMQEDGSATMEEQEDLLSWRSRPEELCHLLSLLFEWKHVKFPSREVVLLSGGPGFGTTGDVCDRVMGLSIPTVVTGPVLGRIFPVGRWELSGVFGDNGRFTYAHRPPSEHWNACVIDVDCGPQWGRTKPAVDVQLLEIPVPDGILGQDGKFV